MGNSHSDGNPQNEHESGSGDPKPKHPLGHGKALKFLPKDIDKRLEKKANVAAWKASAPERRAKWYAALHGKKQPAE